MEELDYIKNTYENKRIIVVNIDLSHNELIEANPYIAEYRYLSNKLGVESLTDEIIKFMGKPLFN